MKRTIDHIHDELLVIRSQGGDAEGFRELVERWHPRLFRFVARLVDAREDARDIEQDVWVTVARTIKRLNDPAAFPQWVYRIAAARCADWVRRTQRDRRAMVRMEEEQDHATQPADANPSESNDITRLRQGIAQLPRDQRIVLTMFYLDDMSVRAISESLGIPEGTVKSRMHTARSHLRELLERRES